MKKKVLTVALVVALIAIMVSGTLAYFTDNDEVTNTFTIGSVKIEIWENGTATDEDVRQLGKLTPIVNTQNPAGDESYIDKVVTVKNTGANAAYLRTFIAIPTALVDYLHLDLSQAQKWMLLDETKATVDSVEYTVYKYVYTGDFGPGDETTNLLKGAYLASNVDLQEDANGNLVFIRHNADGTVSNSGFIAHTKTVNGYTTNTVNVLVASQAIQTEGFTDATTALDSGFGTGNPWN